MRKFKKYLLLLPVVAAVSCGYSVNYLVPGDRYTSANFQENYYRHWDKELKNAKLVETKDVTSSSITNFDDLEKVDPNFSLPGAIDSVVDYGTTYKMSNVDDLFKYGYQSKLFDGQMYCGGQSYQPNHNYEYQKGRVQIDSNGFSARFSKESSDLNYFAMHFKSTTDSTIDCYPLNSDTISHASDGRHHEERLYHSSEINLKVTLYVKTSKGIIGHPYVANLVLDGTNNGGSYIFYAFDLQEEKLSRLVGASVAYEIVEDKLIDWNKEKGIDLDYALMLYEMFFPYTSWN